MKTGIKKISKLKLVELAPNNYHLFVNVLVNDKKCLFIIDTGASGSVIDLTYYTQKLEAKHKTIDQEVRGLHSTQNQTHIGKLKTFSIGTLALKNLHVSCIDLSHVNGAYKQHGLKLKIQGILGSDLLLKWGAVIDYQDLILWA